MWIFKLLRVMWVLLRTAFTHPNHTTLIDFETGKVIAHRKDR